jgi:SAM-dependent methyltransferase
MKVCLKCSQRFEADGWRCPRCHAEPPAGDFLLFAPELAASNDGFEATSFEHLSRLEPTSFWFRSRNRLVVQLAKRHFPSATSLLEVGCGTGFVLSSLHEARPELRVAGSDLYAGALEYAARRLPDAHLYQMDCRHMPFEDEFDVVCAFDVLEHVDEDELVLAEMFRTVRSGGGVIISVPQHPWLWSAGDDFAHHKRRYRRRELVAKVRGAGFVPVQVTSFVGLLLPLMAVARAFQRNGRTYDPEGEYRAPRVVDRALEGVLETERWMIGRGVSIPAGGSLVVVGKKP